MPTARDLRVLADNLAELSAQISRLARALEAENPEPAEPWQDRAGAKQGPFKDRIFR